jgi:hypothetical protein
MIEDIRVGREDPVGEPVLPQILPDILDRIQLRRFSWQRQKRDVRWHLQLARDVPARLIEQQHRMCPGRHGLRDLDQMQRHRLGRAARQHQAGGFAFSRANRPEDVSGGGSQVPRGGGTRATPGPAAGDLVLLADARLIGKPDLERLAISLVDRDFRQTRGKLFLKTATAASLLA